MNGNRNNRSAWKSRDDMALMKTLLNRVDILHEHFLQSFPTKHFWEIVIKDLAKLENIERNARQCRDRFNILYSKGMRNKLAGKVPTNSNEKVMELIVMTFHLDEKGQIILKKDLKPKANSPQDKYLLQTTTPQYSSISTTDSVDQTDILYNFSRKVSSQDNIQYSELQQTMQNLSMQVDELNLRINELAYTIKALQQSFINREESTYHSSSIGIPETTETTEIAENTPNYNTTTTAADGFSFVQQQLNNTVHTPHSPTGSNSMNFQCQTFSQQPSRGKYCQFPYTWGLYTKPSPIKEDPCPLNTQGKLKVTQFAHETDTKST